MSVFNGNTFLREAVESILNQTYGNFEFIIIDDGSTDETWETLHNYSQTDPRILLIRNPSNLGVVRALNRGLEQATGEFIVRQDADDISLPERIEAQVAFLESHQEYGVVGTVPQLIDPQGNFLDTKAFTATQNEDIQEKLLDIMCLCGPSITIRRTAFEAAGYYFSEGLDASEDYDLCLRLAEVTRMASLKENLYLYRQHPDSASRRREQMQMFNKAVALERAIYRRYGPHPSPDHFNLVARDYLHAAIIGCARSDLERARSSLAEALRVYPKILEQVQPLESLVRAYTPASSIQEGLGYTRSIFGDLLPKTRFLSRIQARLISDLHMSQVFDGAREGNYALVDRHLWKGITHQPSWLLNQGVIAILFKGLLGKLSHVRKIVKPGRVND